MIATVQDQDVLDPTAETGTQLRGVLRRQGSDYLLEEPPLPPPTPWPTGRIWRVDVADASPLELSDSLNRDIVVGVAPFYVLSRQHMVMRVAWLHPA